MNTKTEDEGWWRFLACCKGCNSLESMNEFLSLMLTPEERKDIESRYYIVNDLISGEKTQRDIAKERGVSIAKITRGSNSLKTIGEALRSFLVRKMR